MLTHFKRISPLLQLNLTIFRKVFMVVHNFWYENEWNVTEIWNVEFKIQVQPKTCRLCPDDYSPYSCGYTSKAKFVIKTFLGRCVYPRTIRVQFVKIVKRSTIPILYRKLRQWRPQHKSFSHRYKSYIQVHVPLKYDLRCFLFS